MERSIFRAYSIRGVVGRELTADGMCLIGRAVGTLLGEEGIARVVVGRDYRSSSPMLAAALCDGLLDSGMDVVDIGECYTPLLNFATDFYRAGAGLMVTASHNPPDHNGLKIRTDHTLRGKELEQIYRLALSGPFRRGRGRLSHSDPLGEHLAAICRRVTVQRRLRLVVDAGNGAAGPVVPPLLQRLGCKVISLYCDPDGRFPNRPPDPTVPGALADLCALVVEEGADAGLAYDGDADRLVMVDDQGELVLADRLLALLAKDVLGMHPGGGVVYEVSCTQALPDVVRSLGGKAIPCPVGYAFVHEAMRRHQAVLGGETAGHIFFADPEFRFDDALLATARLVALLARADEPLSALLARLPHYCSSPERRLPCPDAHKRQVVESVRDEFVAQGCRIETVDGVRVLFTDGWALFRSSNTQPAVTLRCEATSSERLAEIERVMLDAVHRSLERAHHAGLSDRPGPQMTANVVPRKAVSR